jgi:acyl carrier protein
MLQKFNMNVTCAWMQICPGLGSINKAFPLHDRIVLGVCLPHKTGAFLPDGDLSFPARDAIHPSVSLKQVAPDEPLMAAGLDSLGAVELRNALEGRLGLQLPGTLVFDYPSRAALSQYIGSRLAASGVSVDATREAGAGDEEEDQQDWPEAPAAAATVSDGVPRGLTPAGWAPTGAASALAVSALSYRCVQQS